MISFSVAVLCMFSSLCQGTGVRVVDDGHEVIDASGDPAIRQNETEPRARPHCAGGLERKKGTGAQKGQRMSFLTKMKITLVSKKRALWKSSERQLELTKAVRPSRQEHVSRTCFG